MNIKLDFLWTHLEATSLLLSYPKAVVLLHFRSELFLTMNVCSNRTWSLPPLSLRRKPLKLFRFPLFVVLGEKQPDFAVVCLKINLDNKENVTTEKGSLLLRLSKKCWRCRQQGSHFFYPVKFPDFSLPFSWFPKIFPWFFLSLHQDILVKKTPIFILFKCALFSAISWQLLRKGFTV